MQDLSQIKYVVVLSMENRSFDHVFGGLANEPGKQGTIDVADRDRWTNTDREGKEHGIGALSDALAGVFAHDPDHSWKAVEKQVARDAQGKATMGGFVRDWVDVFRDKARPRDAVLAYLQRKHVPVSYFFAEEYAVLERYFASVATGTMPNRFYALAGDSAGHRDNAIIKQLLLDLPTIFDVLPSNEHDDVWRVYAGALPTLAMIGSIGRKLANLDHVRRLSRFMTDAVAGDLPRLSWLEPTYSWSAGLLARLFTNPDGPPNDDHPPSHTARGQKLFNDVYSALTANPARWAQTLLVIHYDEHGGFFDHVAPPPILDKRSDGIAWMGPRVPCWLISPFAPRGGRIKQQFDHCSILKFLGEWFGVMPPGRAASPHTASIRDALLDVARTDIPAPPDPPPQPQSIAPGQEPPASDVERTAVGYLDDIEIEEPDVYKKLQDALSKQ